jgi:ribosome biogenesis protein Nip4
MYAPVLSAQCVPGCLSSCLCEYVRVQLCVALTRVRVLVRAGWLVLQHKVWVKPAAEMSYLYGNHIIKSGACAPRAAHGDR